MKYYECHGHIALGEGTDEEKLKALKKAGVTYFRDGGDANCLGAKLKERARDCGIKFVTPVYAIYKEGLYGKYLGQPYEDINSFRICLRVAKLARADFAKLILSGIASFKEPGKLSCPSVPEDEMKEMVKICHNEGFSVMAHCNGADTIKQALNAGIDSLEHGIFIDDEGIEMLASSKTIWVPTITAITNVEIQAKHKESIKKAHEKGVLIASGSDSGCGGGFHGKPSILEYEALLDVGLSDAEITKANEEIKSRF